MSKLATIPYSFSITLKTFPQQPSNTVASLHPRCFSTALGASSKFSLSRSLLMRLACPIPRTTSSLSRCVHIPIFGNDIWLHGITAAIAIYFGFIATPDLLELSSGKSHSLSQK
ncbi:hypothetical protein H6G97_38690 [Nostoc flagelliforme FACHB-838]|uniref:Uncharacterized protein n=1 Tax=Nostoc flagelliforme FACHB-838 TaxID=2692904 RepID=A0ABR8E390_9NOSO|nr:hypothetical protein [Nostoc flagelliforme]MBD2535035.1 hypothetical protein [Nostoc flagelliforme FACHB-838]